MRPCFRAVATLMMAPVVVACSMPVGLPGPEHPAPPIAALRYVADPISSRMGSPEITAVLPDGSHIAFANDENKAAFISQGARYRLAKEERIGLMMHDPVARFPNGVHDPSLGEMVIGSFAYSYTYGNVTFLFSSAANRDLFSTDPKKFIAGVGGYCLNAMRNQNTYMVVGDPRYARFVGTIWYIFGGSDGPPRWDEVPNSEKPEEMTKAWAFFFGQAGAAARQSVSLP